MKKIFKNRLATIGLLLAMLTATVGPMFANTTAFTDVPADFWAYEQINRCVQDGIVSGYSDGTFKPGNPVSYGAFSIMLARAFYSDELAGYSDQSTATGEAIMNKHGILNGTSRSSKSIGASLPREDMAQIMYNVLVDKGAKIPSVSEYTQAMSSISDYNTISGNCCRGVLVCYTTGLLGGQSDGSFGPKNPMNRAQGCVVINRLRDYLQNNGGATTPVTPPEQPEKPVDPPEQPETPTEPTTPTVTELPEFKLQDGENVQQMMDRICTSNYVPGYLSNGEAITDEHIEGILADIESSMPQDTEWNRDARYYYSGAIGNGTACNSWAYALSDYIFTKSAPVVTHQNFDKIKVGDVVWVRNSKTGYSHVYVATSMESPPGYGPGRFYQCSGNVNGKVSWGDVGALKGYGGFESPEIMSVSYVYSRY